MGFPGAAGPRSVQQCSNEGSARKQEGGRGRGLTPLATGRALSSCCCLPARRLEAAAGATGAELQGERSALERKLQLAERERDALWAELQVGAAPCGALLRRCPHSSLQMQSFLRWMLPVEGATGSGRGTAASGAASWAQESCPALPAGPATLGLPALRTTQPLGSLPLLRWRRGLRRGVQKQRPRGVCWRSRRRPRQLSFKGRQRRLRR